MTIEELKYINELILEGEIVGYGEDVKKIDTISYHHDSNFVILEYKKMSMIYFQLNTNVLSKFFLGVEKTIKILDNKAFKLI
ncbi:MAG: hypothetical protein GX638_10205 [Crenarchaeota archaeon]|nr:hypothetical protein [Thermoproteota archaeon]